MGKKAKNLKPAAISKLKAWREAQLAEIRKREDELAAQLQAAIPESFAKWREECSPVLIPSLIHYGRASCKYHQDEGEGRAYGYTNLKEFERRFKKLKAAWSGVVDIKFLWDGDYKLDVFFTAV